MRSPAPPTDCSSVSTVGVASVTNFNDSNNSFLPFNLVVLCCSKVSASCVLSSSSVFGSDKSSVFSGYFAMSFEYVTSISFTIFKDCKINRINSYNVKTSLVTF